MGGGGSKNRTSAAASAARPPAPPQQQPPQPEWQAAPQALTAALASPPAPTAPPLSLSLRAEALRGLPQPPAAAAAYSVEAALYTATTAGAAASLRALLAAPAADAYGATPPPSSSPPALAAAIASCVDLLKDAGAWRKARATTSAAATVVPADAPRGDGAQLSWAFASTLAAAPGGDVVLLQARDVRSAPGTPPAATLVLLPEWFAAADGGGGGGLRLPTGAPAWLSAAGPRNTAATAGDAVSSAAPQLLLTVSVAGATATGEPLAASAASAATGSPQLSPSPPLRPAPPKARKSFRPEGGAAPGSPDVGARSPAMSSFPTGGSSAPARSPAPSAVNNALARVASGRADGFASPASFAAAAAAAAALVGPDGLPLPPAVVVLPHAHTFYCDRKRHVCTAEGALREGNRLGLRDAALGLVPAAPGSLHGPGLPPGTRVTWYRSVSPLGPEYAALHAALAAHGPPFGGGVGRGLAGAAPDAGGAPGGLPSPADASTATAAAIDTGDHPASIDDGGLGVTLVPVASYATPPAPASADGGDASAMSPSPASPLASPAPAARRRRPRALSDVCPLPPAPGLAEALARPPPAADPADPHVGSPLFTSHAAARLLRSQAAAALEDPAQHYLALDDVGRYLTAVVSGPGRPEPLVLPVVGPVEPAPPRFREVWVDVWSPVAAAVTVADAKSPSPAEAKAETPAATPAARADADNPDGGWVLQPHGTAPWPGCALVARGAYYGGVPAAHGCRVTWVRVDADGNRSEVDAGCCALPHAPLRLAEAVASPPASPAAGDGGTPAVAAAATPVPGAGGGGASAADARVFRVSPADVGCSFKVTLDPRRWDGEHGAPTTSKPTPEAAAAPPAAVPQT